VPLIEHYDGAVWCTVDSHDWDGEPLYAVAAVGTRDVWAVGSEIEHWDGRAWAVAAAPSAPDVRPGVPWPLTAISASAANNVWAMSSTVRFVERWDGQRWKQVPLPATVATTIPPSYSAPHAELENPHLEALATLSLTDTWVVGESGPGNNAPWAMHWDGRQWHEMVLPQLPAPASYSPDLQAICGATDLQYFHLKAIAALRHDDVWAMGYQDGPDSNCPLAFHWDGAAWHEVWVAASPQDIKFLEQTYNTQAAVAWNLTVMAASRGGDIWAAGEPEEFALHWDGHRWHVVSAFAGPRSTHPLLLKGMSAASADDIWAVAEDVPSPWNAYHWDGKQWRGVAAIPAG